MGIREQIVELHELSYALYTQCRQERARLHQEEFDLEMTPLGEMEIFSDTVAGVTYSIAKGRKPCEHLELLKRSTLEKSIPHLGMLRKYPLIYQYVQNWEKLRKLCIKFLEGCG